MNENNLEKIINNIVGDAIVKEVMSLKLAVKLIETVEEKAAEMGLAVVVAVSDASGRPIAVHCMDGAYHGSFDVAVNKTYTSTAFQMSTAKLSRLCQPGQDLYGLQFSNNGKVMILGGGEPLMVGKTMIGALGVSGGSAQEDSDLAAYGGIRIEGGNKVSVDERMVHDIVQKVMANMQISGSVSGMHGVFKDMNDAINASIEAQKKVCTMTLDQREQIIP